MFYFLFLFLDGRSSWGIAEDHKEAWCILSCSHSKFKRIWISSEFYLCGFQNELFSIVHFQMIFLFIVLIKTFFIWYKTMKFSHMTKIHYQYNTLWPICDQIVIRLLAVTLWHKIIIVLVVVIQLLGNDVTVWFTKCFWSLMLFVKQWEF